VELAVKVQYPGIAEAIKTDMDMLKILLKPTKYARIFQSCFDEIEERIREELDYRKEARNTAWFRQNIPFASVTIPEVYGDLSTEKVITTSHISGLHLDEWLATDPTRKQRDHYGQILVDLFNYTTHEKLFIHADPNLGNYLFREDSTLGLIDFGCVKKLDDTFVRDIALAPTIDPEENYKGLENLITNFGVHYKRDLSDERFKKFVIAWFQWITRPQRHEYFDFSENQDYFEEGMKYLGDFYRYLDYFDGSFIYFGRAEYGLYRILHRLGARAKFQI
jgi:predicted unusual protein kinase regulating ubiquinone biosynthesis (AarF/ABC1/UbiB family)